MESALHHFWWEPYIGLSQIAVIAFTAGMLLAKFNRLERDVRVLRQNVTALTSAVVKMVVKQGLEIDILPEIVKDE